MRDRDVALGDRDEARQPGLGGEQIVAARSRGSRRRRGSRSRRASASGRRGSRSPWRRPSRPAHVRASKRERDEARASRASSRSRSVALDRWPQRAPPPRRGTSASRGSRGSSCDQRLARADQHRPSQRATFSVASRDGASSAGVARPGSPDARPRRRSRAVGRGRRRPAGRPAVRRRPPPTAADARTSSDGVLDPGERRAARGSGRSTISRQACASAMRWPARLPLSTDETYFGSSGRQLARVVPVVEVAAEALEARASSSSVASSRSTVSSVPSQPKSRAATVDSR